MGMLLVFFGTLDQVHTGIWETQKRYFESFFVVWSYPREWWAYPSLGFIRIPMPGGYLLGGALLINLVAAHLTRFRLSWKKAGIHLIHLGLLLLIVSELMTDLLARESQMAIPENEARQYSENFRENELVFVNRGHPDYDQVVSIPVSLLRKGKPIRHEALPFIVYPETFYANSSLGRAGENPGLPRSPATRGLGANTGQASDIVVMEQPVRYDDESVNTVSAIIRIETAAGEPRGTWLVSNLLDDRFPTQTLTEADGSTWDVALRFKRSYHDFALELIDFRFDRYPGTEIPKNFSSEVIVHDPAEPGERKALIYMNHPLRYGGLTFYQASFDERTEATTVLQVVRNPGWLLPYFSVLLMGAGMTLQFSMHLFRFAQRRGGPA